MFCTLLFLKRLGTAAMETTCRCWRMECFCALLQERQFGSSSGRLTFRPVFHSVSANKSEKTRKFLNGTMEEMEVGNTVRRSTDGMVRPQL